MDREKAIARRQARLRREERQREARKQELKKRLATLRSEREQLEGETRREARREEILRARRQARAAAKKRRMESASGLPNNPTLDLQTYDVKDLEKELAEHVPSEQTWSEPGKDDHGFYLPMSGKRYAKAVVASAIADKLFPNLSEDELVREASRFMDADDDALAKMAEDLFAEWDEDEFEASADEDMTALEAAVAQEEEVVASLKKKEPAEAVEKDSIEEYHMPYTSNVESKQSVSRRARAFLAASILDKAFPNASEESLVVLGSRLANDLSVPTILQLAHIVQADECEECDAVEASEKEAGPYGDHGYSTGDPLLGGEVTADTLVLDCEVVEEGGEEEDDDMDMPMEEGYEEGEPSGEEEDFVAELPLEEASVDSSMMILPEVPENARPDLPVMAAMSDEEMAQVEAIVNSEDPIVGLFDSAQPSVTESQVLEAALQNARATRRVANRKPKGGKKISSLPRPTAKKPQGITDHDIWDTAHLLSDED